MTTLEINWEGEGGFVEANCDFESIFTGDSDVCTAERIAKVSSRGFGPVYNLGELIPEPMASAQFPGDWAQLVWIVDGSYLTGGPLDKFDSYAPLVGPSLFPEPSALTLLTLGMLGLLIVRRRRVAGKRLRRCGGGSAMQPNSHGLPAEPVA